MTKSLESNLWPQGRKLYDIVLTCQCNIPCHFRLIHSKDTSRKFSHFNSNTHSEWNELLRRWQRPTPFWKCLWIRMLKFYSIALQITPMHAGEADRNRRAAYNFNIWYPHPTLPAIEFCSHTKDGIMSKFTIFLITRKWATSSAVWLALNIVIVTNSETIPKRIVQYTVTSLN